VDAVLWMLEGLVQRMAVRAVLLPNSERKVFEQRAVALIIDNPPLTRLQPTGETSQRT